VFFPSAGGSGRARDGAVYVFAGDLWGTSGGGGPVGVAMFWSPRIALVRTSMSALSVALFALLGGKKEALF